MSQVDAPAWRSGEPLGFNTARFVVRSMRAVDLQDAHLAWMADPEVMIPLNRAPRSLTRDQLTQHFERCDNRTRFCLGIFDRASREPVGLFDVFYDLSHRVARTDVMIGAHAYWGHGVVRETRDALITVLFAMGAEKIVGRPLARNPAAVFNYKTQGFTLEGVLRGQLRGLDGTRLDQLVFGLLKDEWSNAS